MVKKPSKVRSTALMRAERGTAPVHLHAKEAHLLDRALVEGQKVSDEVEDAIVSFGRWLLVEVFNNDTTAALDPNTENGVWLELVRRAGGPTLRISRNMLSIALRVAANDKRVTDQSWQRMDIGRKQLLLPLREPPMLRSAAQHVMKLNLTQAKTREYVTQLRADKGKPRQVRLTRTGLLSRVRKLREGLAGAAVLKHAGQLKMSDKQRAEVVKEMATLRSILEAVSHAVERAQ